MGQMFRRQNQLVYRKVWRMATLTPKTNELSSQALMTMMLGQMDEQVVEKRMNIFAGLCNRLLDIIMQKEVIQERSLIDFSKQVLWIVNGAVEKLPQSFERLADYIADYWRYELKKEQDSERKYSYIRLFQMINLVKTCYRGREQEKKALLALEEYREYTKLLCLIQRFPGITHKKLREQLGVSSGELRRQLEPLGKEGFLSSRRSGEEQYYMLTNAGEVLFRILRLQKSNNVWFDSWSADRLLALFAILNDKQKHGINGIGIFGEMQSVIKYSEDKISQIVEKIKKPKSSPEKEEKREYYYEMEELCEYSYLISLELEKNMSLKNEIDTFETKKWKTKNNYVFSVKSFIGDFDLEGAKNYVKL